MNKKQVSIGVLYLNRVSINRLQSNSWKKCKIEERKMPTTYNHSWIKNPCPSNVSTLFFNLQDELES